MLDPGRLRKDFPILSKKINNAPLIYLDNAATTQKPMAVIDKITKFYSEYNGNVHRGAHALSDRASYEYETAREKVRAFLNAGKAEEIIFTSGTTESINLVASSYGNMFVEKGGEIIVSGMEHHSNIVPWQALCKSKGAVLKVLPIEKSGRLCIEKLDELITEKTKFVSLVHVSNALGIINPVKEAVEKAHSRGVPVMLDAAQAVRHFPVDVREINCDFLAFSGHKVFAENGIGVLYAKEEYLEKMAPYQTGGGMVSSVGFGDTGYAEIPAKFEAGTKNYAGAASLGAALDYISKIGMDEISEYEKKLYEYAEHKLSEIDGITIYGYGENRAGALSFNIEGIHHYDAASVLDKQGIAVRAGRHCAQPLMDYLEIPGTIRASVALYNTKDDADKLAAGLRNVKELFL